MSQAQAGRVVVTMGVSGAGKSTFGRALAHALRWPFQEGDDLHPAANIAKMRAGMPLDDADRAPWLAQVGGWIANTLRAGGSGVVSCSALKHAYRDELRAAGEGVHFVYLHVAEVELRRRMEQREHFMPPALLYSQLATLEEPLDEPDALVLDGLRSLDEAILATMRWLDAMP